MTTIVQQPNTSDSAGIGFFIGITVLLIALALFFLIGLPYISESRTMPSTIERTNTTTIERNIVVPSPAEPERTPVPDRGMSPAPQPAELPN